MDKQELEKILEKMKDREKRKFAWSLGYRKRFKLNDSGKKKQMAECLVFGCKKQTLKNTHTRSLIKHRYKCKYIQETVTASLSGSSSVQVSIEKSSAIEPCYISAVNNFTITVSGENGSVYSVLQPVPSFVSNSFPGVEKKTIHSVPSLMFAGIYNILSFLPDISVSTPVPVCISNNAINWDKKNFQPSEVTVTQGDSSVCSVEAESVALKQYSKNVEYTEGTVQLKNDNIDRTKPDVLYHLSLNTESHDLVKMFGDVKFVCMGGTPQRMENFAKFIYSELKDQLPPGTEFQDMKEFSYRYSMYKVGPVLAVNHGIGVPTLMVLLHEVIKLMYHARAQNPVFIRIGTSGGIDVEPGTVVVSNGAVDELINPHHEQAVAGKKIQRPAVLDEKLAEDIRNMSRNDDGFQTILGKTMCSNDFYEGQARLDGAVCEHSLQDKIQYLHKLKEAGVKNIEMECTAFSSLTHHVGIKAAIVCVTFLNRLLGDQCDEPKEVYKQWEQRPQIIVSRYIKSQLQELQCK